MNFCYIILAQICLSRRFVPNTFVCYRLHSESNAIFPSKSSHTKKRQHRTKQNKKIAEKPQKLSGMPACSCPILPISQRQTVKPKLLKWRTEMETAKQSYFLRTRTTRVIFGRKFWSWYRNGDEGLWRFAPSE